MFVPLPPKRRPAATWPEPRPETGCSRSSSASSRATRAPAARPPARRPSSSSPTRPRPARRRSRRADEAAVVRRALDARSPRTAPGCRDRASASCSSVLLSTVPGARELDPRVERLDDRRLGRLEAVLEVDGRDRGLEQRGEHVVGCARCARAPAPGTSCACSSRKRTRSSSFATAAQLWRETTCALIFASRPSDASGKPVVQRLGDRELEHRVAEELEPLVRRRPVRRPRRCA